MAKLEYVKGDLFKHAQDRNVIAHICNNKGGWGAGFTGALSQFCKYPEIYYRQKTQYLLGTTDILDIYFNFSETIHLYVANMIAQDGYSSKGKPACDLLALQTCLLSVSAHAKMYNCEVICPKLGAGLGGRNWNREIIPLIDLCLVSKGIDTIVYEL